MFMDIFSIGLHNNDDDCIPQKYMANFPKL